MADLASRIREAADELRFELGPRDVERLRAGTRKRLTARTRRRIAAAALGVSTLVAVGAFSIGHVLSPGERWVPSGRVAVAEHKALPLGTARIHVGAGVDLEIVGDTSTIRTDEVSHERVRVEVRGGTVRFDVQPQGPRVVEVWSGDVEIAVIGTAFSVAREDEIVRVAVEHGRVRMRCGDRASVLGAGARRECPAVAEEEAPAPVEEEASRPVRRPSWRALAAEGEFEDAYRVMRAEGAPLRDDPAELLQAADVARLSGHPRQAIAPLERVLRNHRGDPRAPLAAFTLGRVQLEELGDPRGAAAAFARARALAPNGPLAEDALAREVQALSRAGDTARAHQRAEEYVRRHPNGSRMRSVRRYGGLE
jgi:transmembrane sensor